MQVDGSAKFAGAASAAKKSAEALATKGLCGGYTDPAPLPQNVFQIGIRRGNRFDVVVFHQHIENV
jgi:hypothetical protein